MDLLREARWPLSSNNRRYHERETAVAMNLIDQLSTYIYVYVYNYQNKIHFLKIMKLFLPLIECLSIYGICSWRVYIRATAQDIA